MNYTVRALVGGARKTCKNVTEEGLPNIADELAQYFLNEPEGRLRAVLRRECSRGHFPLSRKGRTEFVLSDEHEVLRANILVALKEHIEKLKEREEQAIGMQKHFGVASRFHLC